MVQGAADSRGHPIASGRVWWRGLTPWGRVSLMGLAAAALLAIGLGVYIPRQVERHMLDAQTAANAKVLDALLGTRTLPLEPAGRDFAELDAFVQTSILRGNFVRVKLWGPDGEILYSDEPRLVEERFPPSTELREALAGKAQSEISNLSDPENRYERGLAGRLLEFYLPVEQGGQVVAVWEVYESLDPFLGQLEKVRRAVWISVGTGLAVLCVFLVSSFGALLRVVQRGRREAEDSSRRLGTLLQVSRSVGASLDPEELARSAVTTVREAGGFRSVALVRRSDGDSPGGVVASSQDPGCPDDCLAEATPGTRSHPSGCTSFVCGLGGETDLLLVACRDQERGFTDEERDLLKAAGEQVRIGLENSRLYESLRSSEARRRLLMSRLVSAHEDERRRIVGEIHDGLGQDVHRVLFGLRGIRSGPAEEITAELDRLEELVEQSGRRLRRLLQDLRPSTLEDVGLAASLRSLVDLVRREDGLQVELRTKLAFEPQVPARVAAFRIVQEALRNVARHAATDRAVVELIGDDSTLTLRIADEGRGFSVPGGGGLGLWLMHERAEAVGGTLSIESDGGGTVVLARIPLEPNS